MKKYMLTGIVFFYSLAFIQAQLNRLTYSEISKHGHFGKKLEIFGSQILIAESNYGIPLSPRLGRVHIFIRNDKIWTHKGILANPDGKAYDQFGFDLSLDGNNLAISAPGRRDGTVFLYQFENNNWTPISPLNLPQEYLKPVQNIRFGERVKLYKDWLIVSAPGYPGAEDLLVRTGAVFTYKKQGQSWVFQQRILPFNLERSTLFAHEMAMADSLLAISAPKADGGALSGGVVYLFKPENNTWTLDYTFINTEGRPHELFGMTLDIDQMNVAIGVPMYTNDPAIGPEGAVTVFQRSGNTWIRSALLRPKDAGRNDMFGMTIALENGSLYTGAPRYDLGGIVDLGKVYVFQFKAGVWVETTSYEPPQIDVQPHSQFGSSIKLHQNQLLIGSHLLDNTLDDSGVAYTIDVGLSTGLGSSQVQAPDVNIFPNPASEYLKINLGEGWNKGVNLKVYSINGQPLVEQIARSPKSFTEWIIQSSGLAPGTYFLQVADDKNISIHKWIKM